MAVLVAAIPLGVYLTCVLRGQRIPILGALLEPLERVLYRAMHLAPGNDQTWPAYAGSLLGFSLVSQLALYAQLRLQPHCSR